MNGATSCTRLSTFGATRNKSLRVYDVGAKNPPTNVTRIRLEQVWARQRFALRSALCWLGRESTNQLLYSSRRLLKGTSSPARQLTTDYQPNKLPSCIVGQRLRLMTPRIIDSLSPAMH